MNKRGQVFLMAALIIAGILISLVRISNQSTARDEPEAFFDLSDEISFETKRVLDYGVINAEPNISGLASQLLSNYSEAIGDQDVAFVYGNPATGIYAYYYNNVQVIGVTLFNGIAVPITIQSGSQIVANYSSTANTVTIRIDGVDYVFNLKPGQNFYFVLAKDEEGEKFVTVE
ncbi:MAG: hypothetical protein AABX10_02885 [Nanoarchaeota archaeon]